MKSNNSTPQQDPNKSKNSSFDMFNEKYISTYYAGMTSLIVLTIPKNMIMENKITIVFSVSAAIGRKEMKERRRMSLVSGI